MSELLELRLEIEPGVVKATGAQLSAKAPGVQTKRNAAAAAGAQGQAPTTVLSLEIPRWSDEVKQEVLIRLAQHPGELYGLLQGNLSGGLAAMKFLPGDEELALAGQKLSGPEQMALLGLVKKQLKEEPLLALELRGLDKETLLAGVFALWAEEEVADSEDSGPAPSGLLAAELARLERKGPAVPTGEWLAEAAAEGSLHQPGPMFHEIAARPFPASPVVAKPTENWGALLDKTPRAGEGLVLIMQRVAEAAARRAAGLGKL
jgi:uncharacterized Zn finger protein